ncbi:molybdate transport system regulatory protein [Haloplanus vescus]|uniref:Molybdate transport system regulatory protein n=1 Tax=Haloplanus vescus TaxID=555874 RepID=A0A1H3VY46_9EURY|nr:TOBE domain-containing protein [Haloplanus vescus]SDZ79795.1 molybdate transport system regulatory protein [Haloplanus vescus]
MDFSTEFDARIGQGDVTLTARDVTLLRAIDDHGSINAAATALERSYSRAQQRIVELEDTFGDLVTRERGGSGGGGSRLTAEARDLLARYDRLRAEFSGVAETAETALDGRVVDREGELATVETDAGTVRALVPGDTDGEVRLTIRADAVTLQSPSQSPDSERTSARNRLAGVVQSIDAGESVALVTVDVGSVTLSALVTDTSVEKLDLQPGTEVVASLKATATRGIPVGGE